MLPLIGLECACCYIAFANLEELLVLISISLREIKGISQLIFNDFSKDLDVKAFQFRDLFCFVLVLIGPPWIPSALECRHGAC